MRKLQKVLALALGLLMLLSALPVTALGAETSGMANEVVYNLGDQEIPVRTDGGEEDLCFAADGSFTIPLEPDALFPYEVQFTCEGEATTVWFMTPEDCVTVGGHDFYVTSEQSGEALTQLGVWVGDEYIPAYPEKKTFTNDGPAMMPFSMMPLEEKDLYLDMRGYLPEELKAVRVETILSELHQNYGSVSGNETVAAWAKLYYYDENYNHVSENDDYVVLHSGDTIDLSNYTRYDDYGNTFTLELIVGTADQLNTNNQKYVVTVSVSNGLDILDFKVADKDRAAVQVCDTYFDSDAYRRELDGHVVYAPSYQVMVNEDDLEYHAEAYLSMAFKNPAFATRYDVAVLHGGWSTYEEIQEILDANDPSDDLQVDATEDMWNIADISSSGGYLANYAPMGDETHPTWQRLKTLVIWKKGQKWNAEPLRIMPFVVNMYRTSSYVVTAGLYADPAVSSYFNERRSVWRRYDEEDWDATLQCAPTIVTVFPDFPANGNYYFGLRMYNPADTAHGGYGSSGFGLEYVKKAVVGNYQTVEQILEAAEDIKAQLFSDASQDGGYQADYSNGVVFTILDTKGRIRHFKLQTVVSTEKPPAPPRPESADTYFRMTGASVAGVAGDGSDDISLNAYTMPYNADSYYYNGYQTVFLLNGGRPVDSAVILPEFFSGPQVDVFAGLDGASGVKQTSGKTEVPFESGKVIQYSAAAENGTHLKNYWVTFLTQQSGPKLFVNATNDESRFDEETGLPVREVYLTEEYNNHHDVFFANIGDAPIEGLYARLEDAQNVALDEYWTIGATKTLSAFTSTYSSQVKNVGKVRLVPETDANGQPKAGDISGTLVIGYPGGEEVKIKLTGVAGTPKITTETLVDGVQYVPYSSVIQTNNMSYADAITFTLESGRLPDGMVLKPNGELYGVPTASPGEYSFMVKATYRTTGESDSKEFTLTIRDHSDENIEWANTGAQGYELLDRVPDLDVSAVSADQLFRSEGVFADFQAFYLDGRRLIEGDDYTKEEGSTRITIRAQTFARAGNGTHVIAAEFRAGGSELGLLKQTSQNVKVSGVRSSGGGGGGGASTAYTVSAGKTEHGAVTFTPAQAEEGALVTVTVKPDAGFRLKSITAGSIQLTKISETQYTFTMPRANVTIQAVFEEQQPDPATGLSFIDVRSGDWFLEAVQYAYQQGLMVGIRQNAFAPDQATTRGMAVTVLYRMSGASAAGNQTGFADVKADSYYHDAVQWAVDAGIVVGYADGFFHPEESISRQQVAAMLYRFAEYCGYETAERADLSGFQDIGDVDSYSLDAVAWANSKGLLLGTSIETLEPNGEATRAQLAALLMRFCENIIPKNSAQEQLIFAARPDARDC